jgi:hypothetical protein
VGVGVPVGVPVVGGSTSGSSSWGSGPGSGSVRAAGRRSNRGVPVWEVRIFEMISFVIIIRVENYYTKRRRETL